MGRKRWWKGGLELLVLCFFQSVIHGDGNIGCLFSKYVCRSGVETCYDDSAFGICIRPFGALGEEFVYKYDLDVSDLELLRKRLEKLVAGGYEWSHPYTQCIMQVSLYNLKYKLMETLKDDVEYCEDLVELDERIFDEYGEEVEPQEVLEKSERIEETPPLAVVNFTPTRGHGYGDFADEKYYPPVASLKKPKYNRRPLNDDSEDDYTYGYSSFNKKPERQRVAKLEDIIIDKKNIQDTNFNDENMLMDSPEVSTFDDPDHNPSSRHFRELTQRINEKYDQPIYRLRRQPNRDELLLRNYKSSSYNFGNYMESAKDILRDGNRENSKVERDHRYLAPELDKYLWKFMKNGLYVANETAPKRNNNDNLGLDFLNNDDDEILRNADVHVKWIDRDTGDEEEEEEELDNSEAQAGDSLMNAQESLDRSANRRKNGMYTEGGLVQPLDIRDAIKQDSVPDDIVFDDDDLLMWSRDLAAFQRNERLDVKKPGPLFSTNNYAFKTQSPANVNYDRSLKNQLDENQHPRTPLVKKKSSDDDKETYDNVDRDHMYIQFDSDFKNWEDGKMVVAEVARLLGYDPDSFSNVRVGRAEVTFKVNDEVPEAPVDIAPKVDDIREELRKSTGRVVVSAGVGDRVKLPPSMEVLTAPKAMSTSVFGAIVAGGGAAAAAAAVVTLIIARKHAKSRAKLAGLATPDPEASKDYQELCRARMQAKQPNEKPESPRIISLSRESESNRSSTSSWGEEAAALTNMDISTGHMVLTYMEDHLKNKDRLNQEWTGICAYEAEPSSVAIATDKSNADRNRPGSSLPYDHSRVVLNDLSNAVNSDYINASTITDHDPRNPAYIATQGPLPQTSADFWQLVWEQGSVVIVMLTRLTEEGRGMCHRYWPEEGSELYHFYEVHLVSEHIWCDDYLVRSFYLKNLRTGETRTVTQFHFLSWPENGVPQSTKALLEFRRKVNKSYRGRSCPIVVHCSDGAGRTGTYCLIDMVLNRMAKGAKEIDIAAALEHIRDQRPGMVATKQQFEFVLGAVAEEVHAILKALPVQPATEKSQLVGTQPSANQSSSNSDQ